LRKAINDKRKNRHKAKLEKPGKRLRDGAAKTHPATEKELSAVREALRQQSHEEERAKPKEQERERDRGR
jgi:hypothetical protein